MRILQVVIVVLGVLIIGGFAFIGVEVYQRATKPNHPRAFGKTEEAPDPTLSGTIADALPAGTEIGEPVAVGYKVAVRVVLPDGTQQLLVIDPATAKAGVLLRAPPGAEE